MPHFSCAMSLGTEYSAVIFSKDLPQSSFLAESSMPLTASRFKNAPKTLFDELMDGNLNDLKIASDQVSENDEAKQSDAEVGWFLAFIWRASLGEYDAKVTKSQRSKEHDMDDAGSMDRILKDTEVSAAILKSGYLVRPKPLENNQGIMEEDRPATSRGEYDTLAKPEIITQRPCRMSVRKVIVENKTPGTN